MQRDLQGYLFDVVYHCEAIQRFTNGLTSEEYEQNEVVRLAVERAFIVIGEALVHANRLTPELGAHLTAFAEVIAFRNVLVHNYMVIRNEEVMMIIRKFIPKLQQQEAQEWLESFEAGNEF